MWCFMSELDHKQLDAHQEMILKDHLSAELDPQMGRSEERFRQFHREESETTADAVRIRLRFRFLAVKLTEAQANPYRIGGRFRGWVFSIAGAALAACLGFLWAGPRISTQPPPRQTGTVNAS